MKKLFSIISLSLILIAAVFIVLNIRQKPQIKLPSENKRMENLNSVFPEQTVLNFYDEYLKRGNINKNYLTQEFGNTLGEKITQDLALDPIICAFDKPLGIEIHSSTGSSKLKTLTVTSRYQAQKIDFGIELEKIGEDYKISNIICGL